MKQISIKSSLWIKSYGQNNEKMSFFNIVFKTIWAFLSYDYFQIIKITSITFFKYVKLIIGTADYSLLTEYKMRCLQTQGKTDGNKDSRITQSDVNH